MFSTEIIKSLLSPLDMLGMISKIHVTSKKRETVTGLGRPEALAVDWVTDNVYFSDNDRSCE